MTMQTKQSPIIGIFGTSRCGSTWLGSIAASHPDLVYRFEPFHRLSSIDAVREARQLIESDKLTADDIDGIYQALLPTHPKAEKPPFFSKNYRSRIPIGRRLMWPLARLNNAALNTFNWMYSPTDKPCIAFKEINMEFAMDSLVRRAGVPVVYLLRHPCGVTWSHLKGQKQGVMAGSREDNIADKLERFTPELYAQFKDRLDDLSKPAKRALLWRMATDRAMQTAADNPDLVHVIVYENLCMDPLGESRKMFEFLGMPFSDQTAEFLDQSTTPSRWQRWRRGEIGINSYFSVFRDPKVSMDYWRDEMPAEDVEHVNEVVDGSSAYAFGCEHGPWNNGK